MEGLDVGIDEGIRGNVVIFASDIKELRMKTGRLGYKDYGAVEAENLELQIVSKGESIYAIEDLDGP